MEAHAEATVDHLWGWRPIFDEVFRHDSIYLEARRDGRIVGVLPLVRFQSRLFGRAVISLPFLNYGGVLASDDTAVDALIAGAGDVARSFRASHVELRHRRCHDVSLPGRDHKLALTRALPGTSEALWTLLDRKVRNQVRKAQKDGLTARVGGADLLDEFYGVFARNMRDLGTPVYPKALFAQTLRAFPDRATVFVVRTGLTPVAASISLRFRDTVLVPWASSLRDFRQHCPNMLLYWSMMEHAVRGGAAIFDFGRSTPGSGPHHFKLQWGAAEAPLHWEYALLSRTAPPDDSKENPKFGAVIDAWKRLPVPVANAIGPRIIRHIP